MPLPDGAPAGDAGGAPRRWRLSILPSSAGPYKWNPDIFPGGAGLRVGDARPDADMLELGAPGRARAHANGGPVGRTEFLLRRPGARRHVMPQTRRGAGDGAAGVSIDLPGIPPVQEV
eukprot:COSAG04_NODE_6583_length_1299_cov_1.994167_2_plen_118_part_00